MRELLKNGFAVNVERNPVRNSDVEDVEESPVRIFDDDEFKREGATLVKTGSWPGVPLDHIIIGLKELPEEKCTFYRSSHCRNDPDKFYE